MRYIIYKITNNINGKIYIGKHKCDHLDDGYFGSGYALWAAIKKYGKENFTLHLEFELHNQDEMDLLEKCVVTKEFAKLRSNYNMSVGGPNCILYGKNNGFYGKHHTEETKKKLSESHKGFRQTEDNKKRISESLKKIYREHPELRGAYNQNRGKVIGIDKIGNRKFFPPDAIPEGYTLRVLKRDIPHHISEEQRKLNSIKQSERNKKCKWFNNGICEKYCLPDEVPSGFKRGRLSGLNVGRKYTEETKRKMSEKAKVRGPNNKGMMAITNGKETKYVKRDSLIPYGWWNGMTRKNKRKEV